MRVLVTGGAGYIGSVVTEELVKDGHQVVVYDSLYKGHRQAVAAGADFVQADLMDAATLRTTLTARQINAVVHMAADSLVGESCAHPAKYYRNNLAAGLVLLDAMREWRQGARATRPFWLRALKRSSANWAGRLSTRICE